MGKISATKKLVYDAVLMALFVLLSKLTIPLGNYRLTLASLPLVFAALFFSPYDAFLVGLLGEFLVQITSSYGLTPTTPLWLLPPAIRGLCIAFPAWLYQRHDDRLERHLVVYFIVLILAALITSLLNTAVWFLDAYLMNYPYAIAFWETLIRSLLGLATSVIVGLICLPLSKAMDKVLRN